MKNVNNVKNQNYEVSGPVIVQNHYHYDTKVIYQNKEDNVNHNQGTKRNRFAANSNSNSSPNRFAARSNNPDYEPKPKAKPRV